ncbi:23056_t:CDS:2, partial [Dentiscutata erythropus]
MALRISMQQLSNRLIEVTRKGLDILSIPQMKINPLTQEEHALRFDEFVNMLKKANAYQYYIKTYNIAKLATYKEYIYFSLDEW